MSRQKIIAFLHLRPQARIQLVAIEIDTAKTALFNWRGRTSPASCRRACRSDDDGGVNRRTDRYPRVDGTSGAGREFAALRSL